MRGVDVTDQRSAAEACRHKPQDCYWQRPFENKLRQAATSTELARTECITCVRLFSGAEGRCLQRTKKQYVKMLFVTSSFNALEESSADFDTLEWLALLIGAIPGELSVFRRPHSSFWPNRHFCPRTVMNGQTWKEKNMPFSLTSQSLDDKSCLDKIGTAATGKMRIYPKTASASRAGQPKLSDFAQLSSRVNDNEKKQETFLQGYFICLR